MARAHPAMQQSLDAFEIELFGLGVATDAEKENSQAFVEASVEVCIKRCGVSGHAASKLRRIAATVSQQRTEMASFCQQEIFEKKFPIVRQSKFRVIQVLHLRRHMVVLSASHDHLEEGEEETKEEKVSVKITRSGIF